MAAAPRRLSTDPNHDRVPARVSPDPRGIAASIAGVLLFAALVYLGSRLRLPLPGSPVPVTLQTFFVLLAGMMLGPWCGAASQGVYVACGAAGLPAFAGGSGVEVLLGPSGGYLAGFVPAAWVSGRLVRGRAGRSWAGAFAAGLVATGIVLALGAIHRSVLHDADLAASLVPGGPTLLAANAAKAAAAALAYRVSRRVPGRGDPV